MICASIFFGHDSSMSVMVNGEFVCLIEFEKINGIKHYEPSAIRSKGRKIWRDTLLATLEVLKRDYGIKNSFDLLLHKGFCPTDPGSGLLEIVQDVLNVKQNSSMDQVQHHRLHCNSSYVQSGMNRAIVLSYDAGGDDWRSSICKFNDQGIVESEIEYFDLMIGWLFSIIPGELGFKHTMLGYKPDNENMYRTERMDLAGKIMGLSAYGSYGDWTETEQMMSWFMNEDSTSQLNKDSIVKRWGMIESADDEIKIAWRMQKICESTLLKVFETKILPDLDSYDNNCIITGGCAMNVLANTLLREKYPEVNFFVASNPSDAGLSLGMLAEYRPELRLTNGHTSKTRLLDLNDVPAVLKSRGSEINLTEFNDMISEGQVVGFIHGGLEIGARSLCNRSIIASASFPGIKDKINATVKHREWFRPFAPVVQEKDVSLYFEGRTENNEHMAYAMTTKEEWRDSLSSINHVDNTARVQALSRSDSPWIYDLLELQTPRCLLNTSFNISGKPILNTIEDALWVLDNRGLDAVIISHDNKLWKIL